jgi:competence protein ComEC
LIVTHFDQDHVGGAAKVLKSFPVKQVLQSDYPKDSDEYNNYVDALERASLTPTTVQETMTFSLDGVSYTVDPPKQETYSDQASNNSSLIISVGYGTRRFLFAGDAADARLQEFLAERNGSYDFLKVPYHGNYLQTLPAFFASVCPAYAVITCSEDEPEDDATMAALADTEVFLTRIAPVLAESDGTSLTVQYTD